MRLASLSVDNLPGVTAGSHWHFADKACRLPVRSCRRPRIDRATAYDTIMASLLADDRKRHADEVLERRGKWYALEILLLAGFGWVSDGAEGVVMSYMMPALEELWHISHAEQGALGSIVFGGVSGKSSFAVSSSVKLGGSPSENGRIARVPPDRREDARRQVDALAVLQLRPRQPVPGDLCTAAAAAQQPAPAASRGCSP